MTELHHAHALHVDPVLVAEVTAFLTYEADLLDRWELRHWYALFTPDCSYHVPTTDRPEGNADTHLFFIRDDWFLLGQRVEALMDGTAWAESPRSITHRLVTNVRAVDTGDAVVARANCVVYRSALDRLDTYPYVLDLRLQRGGPAGFEIAHRRATLALAQLRPQGRVSIIL